MSYYTSIEELNLDIESKMEDVKEDKNQTEVDRLKKLLSIQSYKADNLLGFACDYCSKIDELNRKIDAISEENIYLRERDLRLRRIVKILLSVAAMFPVKDEFDLQDIFDSHIIDGLKMKG